MMKRYKTLVMVIIFAIFMTLLFDSKMGLTANLLEKYIEEAEDIVIQETNISIERVHDETALAGEEIEIILNVTNLGDEDVELAVSETHNPVIEYLDPLVIEFLQYAHFEIPSYLWHLSLPAGASEEIIYHIRSEYPIIISFPAAIASDQYNNHFESESTSMTIMCVPDGECGYRENFILCPEDCTTGLQDGMCDGLEDGRCDLDCLVDADPDCSGMDDDNDNIPDEIDNCVGIANDQRDTDLDGLGDECDPDDDDDDVLDQEDNCPRTKIPEDVPTIQLGVNRFALVDGDGVFDTTKPKGKGPKKSFTISDTFGCSCEQILNWLHEKYPNEYGDMEGHWKFGCSISVMEEFIELND